MAQNFRRYTENNVGTSAVDIPDGSNFDSYDAIVGISLANVGTSAINVDCYINDGSNDIYLVKSCTDTNWWSITSIRWWSKDCCSIRRSPLC